MPQPFAQALNLDGATKRSGNIRPAFSRPSFTTADAQDECDGQGLHSREPSPGWLYWLACWLVGRLLLSHKAALLVTWRGRSVAGLFDSLLVVRSVSLLAVLVVCLAAWIECGHVIIGWLIGWSVRWCGWLVSCWTIG